MIEAGEAAAMAAMPEIKKWFPPAKVATSPLRPLPTQQLAS
jgi:hypothetical protein